MTLNNYIFKTYGCNLIS